MSYQSSGVRIPRFSTKKSAEALVGTLSRPSKMPCHGYSLPAWACQVGSKLSSKPNTPCSNCYAKKRRYTFPNVQNAMSKRLSSIDHPNWVDAMIFLIQRTGDTYFRWHDSGDIQSLQHLNKIVTIAEELPHVQFWLPTQEYGYVTQYIKQSGKFPRNLTVRVSSPVVDSISSVSRFPTSAVVRSASSSSGHVCPAPSQNNQCGSCRACWDAGVANVCYIEH